MNDDCSDLTLFSVFLAFKHVRQMHSAAYCW